MRYCLFPLVLCMSLTVFAQTKEEPRALVPGQAIEREITGGDSHAYQINLATGQFVRLQLDQRSVDAVLILTAPDGKQLVEMNLTGIGEAESLSLEAKSAGSYRLTVRGNGAATHRGLYRLETAVTASVTAPDRKRLAAEALLVEVTELKKQTAKTAQQVIDKLQPVLPIWRELGEPAWAAYSLSLIGYAYGELRQYEKAIEYHQQALAISRESKLRMREGKALRILGLSHSNLNHPEKAIEYQEQALLVSRELQDLEAQDTVLRDLGNSYLFMARYEKAIEYYEQARVIANQMKNRASEAMSLRNLGIAYQWLSRTENAIKYYEQALAIHRELKNRAGEGITLVSIGNVYQSLSRYERAIEYYEQGVTICHEVGNRTGEANGLGNLGLAYAALGRYEKAIEFDEQAITIFRELRNRRSEENTLGNLGLAYGSLGRHEKAIEYQEQALAIARAVKDRFGEGQELGNLGVAYFSLGRYEKALAYYEQSLAINREVKDRRGEGQALENLGEACRLLSRLDEATSYHEQAVRIAREVKAQSEEASALNNLMLDWKTRNGANLAIYFGKQSVNAYQEIRNNIRTLDLETQRGFLKSKEQTYRDLADLLISEGRLPEAEQVIRMLKEEEYFEYIRRDSANAPQGARAQLTPAEAALERREREIADQLAVLGTERGTLMDKKSLTPDEEQRLAKLDSDLVVAGNAFQKFLDQLTIELGSSADSSGRVFQLRESQGLMEDLRELGKGTVALYTLVGQDKYRMILTTADFQKGYEYPIKAADLNRKVLEFREALQNPKLDPLPLAQELYQILFGPVAKDLAKSKTQTIMWSLDGVLRYVPVSALHDGKQYLVEQYQSVVFTPASQARLKDAPARNWNALGLGVSKAHGEKIPALPGVIDEMRGIIREEAAANGPATIKQNGVLPGVVKLDEQFTQETMLTQLRHRPKVVHIASHFQFSPGNETNSALLLGDGSFLSLAQIKSLPNIFGGVDLLTLSACNTATGGSGANGKEVEGFGVLAQRQGAKAVVASLWPVADRSTKLLMQEFYRAREARNGESKIAALREAQLKLLRGEFEVESAQSASRQITHEDAKPAEAKRPLFKLDPKAPFAHPYYWAPFILIGNWK